MESMSSELGCCLTISGQVRILAARHGSQRQHNLRVIHYPALGENSPEGAVRSAQHEDINLITLLVGATADGLQVMDHDGTWIEVEGNHDHIIVDSGDMLQNLTNGLFKSTTHRVINPADATSDRYSMPMFVHPEMMST